MNGQKTMLEKVDMKTKHLKTLPLRGNGGFTAIEIAMVAAVIAILSLIVLPIFRNRVEDAKIAAALADLSSLMKAEQVVKADTDAYARLEDLDNVELLGYTAIPANGVDKEVPFFQYISPTASSIPADTRLVLTQPARQQLAGQPDNPKWRGPYIAFQNAVVYENLKNTTIVPNATYLLRSLGAGGGGGLPEAPIQDITTPFRENDKARYPVDPWGNPYLFFPPNGNNNDPNSPNGEYSSAAIYSLGPNGAPGDGLGAPSADLFTRRNAMLAAPNDTTVLGRGDDLMVEF